MLRWVSKGELKLLEMLVEGKREEREDGRSAGDGVGADDTQRCRDDNCCPPGHTFSRTFDGQEMIMSGTLSSHAVIQRLGGGGAGALIAPWLAALSLVSREACASLPKLPPSASPPDPPSMPPKKGASSTEGSGRTTFLSTVPTVDQLTPAHALQLAGVSQAAAFSLGSDRSAPSPVASGSGSSKSKRSNGKEQEDPIELSDTTDDEGIDVKGESRESSDGGDAGRPPLRHVCKKATCTNNPNCLAFLGQDKWEDKGSSKTEELCRPLQNASYADTLYSRNSPTPPTLPRLSPSTAIRESSTSVHEDPRARREPHGSDARAWYTVRTPSASCGSCRRPLRTY